MSYKKMHAEGRFDGIADNYRRAYKNKYGSAYGGTTASIAEFADNASLAPTAQDRDEWVLEDMRFCKRSNARLYDAPEEASKDDDMEDKIVIE